MAVLIETRLNALKLNESANPRKGCLGRLEGICADFKNPTRNGRLYTRKLWENVFNDPIFKESLESKTLLGELDHPEDRLEVLAGEACIVMTDYRIDEDEGVIYAGFDILDTPRGKILKTLLDYGCVMGVSSRGQGDITTTSAGETVDEDTYDFACFDVVTTPAVEKARQNVVESVGKTKRFVESIRTQIKEAETIGDLNAIKRVVEATQSVESDSLLESIQNKCNSIKEGRTTTSETSELPQQVETLNTNDSEETTNNEPQDNSAKTIREQKELLSCINNLRKQVNAYKYRESKLLQVIQTKTEQIESLQTSKEKLGSVTYTNSMLKRENKQIKADGQAKLTKVQEQLVTKETEIISLQKQFDTAKDTIDTLRGNLSESKQNVKDLQKDVSTKTNNIKKLTETINSNNAKITRLQNANNAYKSTVSDKDETIKELNQNITDLKEQLHSLQSNMTISEAESDRNSKQMESEINSYTELVDNLHNEARELRENLNKANESVNSWSKRAKQLQEQLSMYQHNYVNTKSRQLGVDPTVVQKYVNTSTTVSQINKIVEDLRDTKDRYAKLPISESAPVGVTINSVNVNQTDPEEDRLTKMVEKVVMGQ